MPSQFNEFRLKDITLKNRIGVTALKPGRSKMANGDNKEMRRSVPVAAADDIRELALSFEGVAEADHWNRPAFRTSRRIFAVIRADGLWLYLPEERKEFLFAADPDTFVKYMWGKHPELIVQSARVAKAELAALLREAYEHALPPKKEAGRGRSKKKAR